MNIMDVILKSLKYEKVELYRYTITQDIMGRDIRTLVLIGTYTMSIQPTGSQNKVQGLTLVNSPAGEKVDEVFVSYSQVIDVKTKDLIKRIEEDNLFYEVRSIEVQKVNPTLLKNGNVLDLSHIRTYITRIDNQ